MTDALPPDTARNRSTPEGPAGARRRPHARALDRILPVAEMVLIVWAAILLSLYGIFLTPYRIGTVLVPVSLVLATAGNWGLMRLAYGSMRKPWLSLLPGLAWIGTAVAFFGQTTEGDIVLAANNWVAGAYLFTGIIAITATAYTFIARPR